MDLNFLRNLRLGNIFDPMAQQAQSPTFQQSGTMSTEPMPQQAPNAGLYNVADRMSQLYTPETGANDRFNQMLDQYPQERPISGKRKLAGVGLAALADFAGGGDKGKFTYDEITGKNQQREDLVNWKNQITPAQQAADNERATNTSRQNLAHQQIADELRQQAQDEIAKKNTAAAAISQQRADAYTLKSTKPDFKFDFKGPTVMVTDPATGKITDSKIPTGSLTDADKIALQQNNAMQRIEAQGKNQNTVSETRGWKIGTVPDPNDPSKQIGIQYNEITGETKPLKFNGQATTITPSSGAGANGKQAANIEDIQQKTRETLSALDELLDPKTDKLRPEITGAVGASRIYNAPFGYTLPGSQTKASDAAINRLKSMLTIEILGEMKAQSRTGATGFGQLSVKELNVLESAASKLDPSLDEKTFEAELKRIKKYLERVLQPADGFNPTTTVKKRTAQEMIAHYGGKGGNQ